MLNNSFAKYLKFIKIEHTLFSLPLIYTGVFLGSSEFPSVKLLILVLIAATFARTSAMTINRIIDVKIDKKNPRTSNREIPAGKISIKKAYIIFFISLLGYFTTASFFSPICLMLSPIPIVIFIIYPFLKRFTWLAHFGVGFGLAGAPLGGWLAVNNFSYNTIPIILITLFTVFWGTGFDIIYAQLDEEFDRANGVFSMPAVLGKKKALIIAGILHFISFILLILVHFFAIGHNYLSLILLSVIGLVFIMVHKFSDNVDLAFFKLNSVISFCVFIFIIIKVI